MKNKKLNFTLSTTHTQSRNRGVCREKQKGFGGKKGNTESRRISITPWTVKKVRKVNWEKAQEWITEY